LGAIILGFIPPTQVAVGNVVTYEAILIGGILIFCAFPFFLYHWKNKAA
jgi:hypothetical protein